MRWPVVVVRPDVRLVRRIADAGHALANHSWSHPRLVTCTPERVQTEIADANNPSAARLYLQEFDNIWNASAAENGLRVARRG